MVFQVAPVRYGMMQTTETFFAKCEGIAEGDTVIVRSGRGIEHGQVAGPPEEVDHEVKGLGEILRPAKAEDLNIIQHNHEVKEPEELRTCQKFIEQRKLPMKLAGVEHLFSGDKIVFYFLADGRVDFRDLVKGLAREYRTRIEMRQIGVRDEARMLADYEHCGQELCCRTFLRNLEPVTMRMAKIQKTTLDPTKISGHCGRLMCCLRFEDAVYTEMRKELPPKGEWIKTERFEGEVIGHDIIKHQVTVALQDGSREAVQLSEITQCCGRCKKSRDNRGRGGTERRERSGSERRNTRDSSRRNRDE